MNFLRLLKILVLKIYNYISHSFILYLIAIVLLAILILSSDSGLANLCGLNLFRDILNNSIKRTVALRKVCSSTFVFEEIPSIGLASKLLSSQLSDENLFSISEAHENQIVRFRVGNIYWKRGKIEAAMEQWKKVPNIDVYFANRSVSSGKLGDLESAVYFAEISQAIDSFPTINKAPMYKMLCLDFHKAGDNLNALPWCQLAVQALPNGWTHIQLADVLRDLGENEKALKNLQLALEIAPSAAKGAIYQKFGWIYLTMNQLDMSIDSYKTAIEFGHSNQWLHIGLARALLFNNDIEGACENYLLARKLGHKPSIFDIRNFYNCSELN